MTLISILSRKTAAALFLAVVFSLSVAPVGPLNAAEAAEDNPEEIIEDVPDDTSTDSKEVATPAVPVGPAFEGLPGRWMGKGLLGFKDGKRESVTCRVTYFVSDDRNGLKQNIRCASPSGKVEVKSEVKNDGGKLSGTWSELIYNLTGELTGEVTAKGLRVYVKAPDLNASMDVIVKGTKQIVEINFNSATLIGMTLVLDKG